jgi:hypothetical protein
MVILLQNIMWNIIKKHDKKRGIVTQYEMQIVVN